MRTVRATETDSSPAAAGRVFRGRHLVLFLLLTFGLSWGFELLIALTIGHRTLLGFGLAPWSMYVPAAVGLALQRFAFRHKPSAEGRDRSALIPLSFLGLTVLHGFVTGVTIVRPEHGPLLESIGNLIAYVADPRDNIWSFGLGLYGLLSLPLVVGEWPAGGWATRPL